jgi:peptide/nickel transport system substrate-binding protein
VIDDRNGIIHLTEAFAPFIIIALPYYGGHIVCQKAVEAVGGSYTTEIPAQCGPYLFDSWEQNQKVTLVEPRLDRRETGLLAGGILHRHRRSGRAAWPMRRMPIDFTRVAVGAAAQLKGACPTGPR